MKFGSGSRLRRNARRIPACSECGEIATHITSISKASKHDRICRHCGGKIVSFPSKAEWRRFQELVLLQKAGEIERLQIQPSFRLVGYEGRPILNANGRQIFYRGDFRYYDTRTAEDVVEDVKNPKFMTRDSNLKIAIFRAMWSGPGRRFEIIHK